MESGDAFIVLLLVLGLILWLFLYIRGKLKAAVGQGRFWEWKAEEDIPEDEATQLLAENGYQVLCGKRRIPVLIEANEEDVLQSRLFIDYMAERDGQYFAVKLAKDRKPLERTGSAIRDRLLIYQLLDKQTEGVLYIHLTEKKIDCYRFRFEEADDE